jgi:hypothetical protein
MDCPRARRASRAVVRRSRPNSNSSSVRLASTPGLAVSASANVKAVQRMLGHAKASMTLDVYADLFDEDLEGVAARLDAAIQATADGFTSLRRA